MSDVNETKATEAIDLLEIYNQRFAERFVFEDSAFHRAVMQLVNSLQPSSPGKQKSAAQAREDGAREKLASEELARLKQVLDSKKIAEEIDKHSGRGDKTFRERWNGLRGMASFLLGFDARGLDHVIASYDALGPKGEWPRPSDAEAVIGKLISAVDASRLKETLERPFWTSGQFLVFDLIRSIYLNPANEVQSERTPILVVVDLPNRRTATTLWLTLTRHPGGGGLIMPNWWKLGLVALAGQGREHFRSALERAIRLVAPDNRYRYYWNLSFHSVLRPESISGRSAEASAACCALALNERRSDAQGPLLDDTAAISAMLGDLTDLGIGELKLEQVDKDSFENKLDAAGKCGLISVSCCKGQLPDAKVTHPCFTDLKGQRIKHEVLLSGVSTLADAYDSLLITSKAIAAYKREIVLDWKGGEENGEPLRDKKDPTKIRGRWIEVETHADFKDKR